jgi:hypothetical protein
MNNAYYQWLQQQQQQAQAQQQQPNFQGQPQQQLPPQPPLGPPQPIPVPKTRGGFFAKGGGFSPTPDQQQAIDRGGFLTQQDADAYANQQRQGRNKGLGNMMMALSDAFGGRPIEPGVQQRQQYQQQQNEIAKKKAQYEAIMNDANTAPATKRLLKSLGWQNMDQFLLKKYELDNRVPKERKTANIDGVLRYIDTGEQVYPGDKGDRPPERKVIKGGDGYNYYVNDDGTTQRVLPGVTIPESQTDNRTANQKNYDAYSKIMAEGNEQQKELAGKIFISGTNQLKTKEQFLISIAQNVSGREFITPEEIREITERAGNLYDYITGSKENTSLPQGFQGSAKQWQELKKANPNGNDQELIAWFNQNYGG